MRLVLGLGAMNLALRAVDWVAPPIRCNGDEAVGWTTEESLFDSLQGGCYSSLKRRDCLWVTSSLLFQYYRGIIPRVKVARAWSWPLTSIYRICTSNAQYAFMAYTETNFNALFGTVGFLWVYKASLIVGRGVTVYTICKFVSQFRGNDLFVK